MQTDFKRQRFTWHLGGGETVSTYGQHEQDAFTKLSPETRQLITLRAERVESAPVDSAKRTVTIERSHIYGTPRHELIMRYRGLFLDALAWYEDNPVERMKDKARAEGFTHAKFTGDWSCASKPKDCAL